MAESPIESHDKWTKADLRLLTESRKGQCSFHIFSEEHMRGQMFLFGVGEKLDEMEYDGNVLITAVKGTIEVGLPEGQKRMDSLGQMLINPQVKFSVSALTEASFQVIWGPPFAKLTKTL